MDVIVAAALNEISASGSHGCDLKTLWKSLQQSISSSGLQPSEQVSNIIWKSLIKVPGLGFYIGSDLVSYDHEAMQNFQTALEHGICIVSPSHLRDCCLGIYGIKSSDSGLSSDQQKVLERLAKLKGGIPQHQLVKEFGMKPNKFFYTLKSLESRGLIVRQSTIFRTKDEKKGDSVVSTNLVCLSRYAKTLNLGCQKRFEITANNGSVEIFDNDYVVKDDLPAIKAICEKLEESDGHVMVVHDLKTCLGYRLDKGHRAWTRISKRLVNAGLVELFLGQIEGKAVKCVKLLRSFDPKVFYQRDFNDAVVVFEESGLKPCKDSEQVVEAPVDHQIYDMIENAGAEGLRVMDVFRRLGINNRKNYHRISSMIPRFGLHLETEAHKRTTIYRVWTKENKKSSSRELICYRDSNVDDFDLDMPDSCEQGISAGSMSEKKKQSKFANCETVTGVQGISAGSRAEKNKQTKVVNGDFVVNEELSVAVVTEQKKYRRMANPLTAQREQKILDRVQKDKFILKPELYRFLDDSEKDRVPQMARRTLNRALKRLEEQGFCKEAVVRVPSLTNYGGKRTMSVILQPSVELDEETLDQIHGRIRRFDVESRVPSSSSIYNVHDLSGIGIKRNTKSSRRQVVFDTRRANGFIRAKMVRVKMLHQFMWNYVGGLDGDAFSKNESVLFDFQAAVRTMPLELFLQVVGSMKEVKDVSLRCKEGTRLCDLPSNEYKNLMDKLNTGRLSGLIDVIRRLKLLRLVQQINNEAEQPHAVLAYALEFKPYIEEPEDDTQGFWSKKRHDFTLHSVGTIEEYWKMLEQFYCGVGCTTSMRAFPGSSVPEILGERSWNLSDVMSVEKRIELGKRLASYGTRKFLTRRDCKRIANDLQLPIDYVLTMSQEKNRALGMQQKAEGGSETQSSSKRKRPGQEEFGDLDNEEEQVEFSDDDDDDGRERKRKRRKMKLQIMGAETDNEGQIEEFDGGENCNALTKLKPTRKLPFKWTKRADESLIKNYAVYRARMGFFLHRMKWKTMPDLPASAHSCKRRFSYLKAIPGFKKAITNLCELLYVKNLKRHLLQDGDETAPQGYNLSTNDLSPKDMEGYQGDDFNDPTIALALDEVFQIYRSITGVSRKCGRSGPRKRIEFPSISFENVICSPDTSNGNDWTATPEKSKLTGVLNSERKFKRRRIFREKGGYDPEKVVQESVAAANAVELIKLILLTFSQDTKFASLLLNKLMSYKQTDVHAAFRFLRDRGLVVMGDASLPFKLSPKFFEQASASPFQLETGERASNFAKWLTESDKQLENDLDLPEDLHCGDLFHLFGLVSQDKLIIYPSLPSEGVGECEKEVTRTISQYFQTNCMNEIGRRKHGFPGINVHMQWAVITLSELFSKRNQQENQNENLAGNLLNTSNQSYVADEASKSAMAIVCYHPQNQISSGMSSDDLNIEALTDFAKDFLCLKGITEEELSNFQGGWFLTALDAIEKNEGGLRFEQIGQAVGLEQEEQHIGKLDAIVEALQAFKRVRKVNGFDHTRVVLYSESSEYFVDVPSDSQAKSLMMAPDMNIQDNDPERENVKSEYSFPIYPWIMGNGQTNNSIFKGLARCAFGIIMQNPGILEDSLIQQLSILNPQSAKKLLELLQLDKHVYVRTICQTVNCPPPSLRCLTGRNYRKQKPELKNHYYANQESTYML